MNATPPVMPASSVFLIVEKASISIEMSRNSAARNLVSPQAVLHDLLHRCQMEAIDVEVHRREREFQAARQSGDLDGQRESQLAIMKLRREKDSLRHAPPPRPDA